MVLLVMLFVAAIVDDSIITAYSAKHKHIDTVPTEAPRFGGMPRYRIAGKFMPTPEEVTEEEVVKSEEYDASDDLLDPKNPGHAQWLAEHPDAEGD